MKKSSEILLAETYGIAAFEQGAPSIPVLDSNLMQMLEGLKPGEGSVNLLKAWTAGWTKANLAAPVE